MAAVSWWIWDGGGWPVAAIILALLTLQRALELVYANRNTRALLARGAVEIGRGHYPVMVAIHAAFLLSLWLLTPPYQPVLWPLALLFVALQAARLWVLATLGRYWTTRIISSPQFPRRARRPLQIREAPQLHRGDAGNSDNPNDFRSHRHRAAVHDPERSHIIRPHPHRKHRAVTAAGKLLHCRVIMVAEEKQRYFL